MHQSTKEYFHIHQNDDIKTTTHTHIWLQKKKFKFSFESNRKVYDIARALCLRNYGKTNLLINFCESLVFSISFHFHIKSHYCYLAFGGENTYRHSN